MYGEILENDKDYILEIDKLSNVMECWIHEERRKRGLGRNLCQVIPKGMDPCSLDYATFLMHTAYTCLQTDMQTTANLLQEKTGGRQLMGALKGLSRVFEKTHSDNAGKVIHAKTNKNA